MSIQREYDGELRGLLIELAAQKVVCRWSRPDLAHLLESKQAIKQVNEWAGVLNMEVAHTGNGEGIYLVYKDFDADAQENSRRLFESLMKGLGDRLRLLELLLTIQPDRAYTGGDQIRFNTLLNRVADNSDLQQRLEEMVPRSRQDSASKDQLQVVIDQMVKDGLLVLVNQKSAVYQVTAAMDLMQDLVVFIQESEQLPEEESDEYLTQESRGLFDGLD